MPPMSLAIKTLLLTQVGLFCLDQLSGGALTQWLGLWPLANQFMPWQVLTYAFLHADAFHLFFNMLGLWMFGADVERILGQKKFLQIYGASVLSAAITQLVAVGITGSVAPTVGASGALFGLLYCFAKFFPHRTIMPLFPPIPMKAKTFVIVFGALELFFGVTGTMSGIAHFAHLGGLVGAWLLMAYWMRGRRR